MDALNDDLRIVQGRSDAPEELIEQAYDAWKPALKEWREFINSKMGYVPVSYEWWRNRYYDTNPDARKEIFVGIWSRYRIEIIKQF